MYETLMDSIKGYAWLTLNVFPFLIAGYFLSKKGHEDENELLCDIAAGCFCWGIMFGMYWFVFTCIGLYYFLIEKPLTWERIMYFVNIIKNGQ